MSADALQKAIDHCGSQAELARRIGATGQQVSNWLLREKRAAARYCVAIEDATDGLVTCHQLRPDVFRAPAANDSENVA